MHAESDVPTGASHRAPLWGGLLAGLAMFAYSWFGDHHNHPADDAGITLRYAERIARGQGFNYNDGEAVNGASNPVYTLIEAAHLRLGLAPGTTILWIASLCLALTAGVLFATFARFYSWGAALFAVVALVAFSMPFESVIDGMETPIVMLLAALLFRVLHARGEILPGIVLGCLVANKLDGALAAVAFAAVFLVSRRRLPWRAAVIALLAAAPVFLLLLASFGSILPNSMLMKLSRHSHTWSMDPAWMHWLLLGGVGVLYLGACASILWLPASRELRRSFPIAVIQVWFVLHMLVFATVNLGDGFHWYTAAPVTHSVILSSFVVHVLAAARVMRSPRPRLAWDPLDLPRRTWPVALVLVLVLGWSRGESIAGRLRHESLGPVPVATSWEIARQSAGAWLRKHTSRTELFVTFEGLPSYEYEGPVYDPTLLNSERVFRRRQGAPYLLKGPIGAEDELPLVVGNRELVATFRYDAKLGVHVLYAKRDSEIWRKGVRHFVHPTPTLRSGRPADRGADLARRDNTWILPAAGHAFFTVQSETPPTLLFTPRLVPQADPVRLVVSVNGFEVESTEILPDRAHVPIRVAAPRSDGTGEYTFEIESSSLGSADPRPDQLELEEVLVRSGEPLRASDFKLTFERDRERIEHVATLGLPCGDWGR